MPPLNAPTLGELEAESAADTARAVLAEMMDGGQPADNPQGTDTALDATHQDSVVKTDETDDGEKSGGGERPRDEKGRFAAKERDEDDESGEGAGEGAAVSDKEADDSGDVAGDEEPLEPFAEWSAQQHEEFHKLSRPAQQFLLDQVAAANERASGASKYDAIEQLLAPRRTAFARDGLDDAGALRQLFALSDMAAQDPASFARWFVQQRGLRPEHIWGQGPAQQQPQGEGQPDFSDDPLYQYMQQENAQIRQQLDNVLGFIQNQQNTAQSQSHQQVASEIQTFGTAKDDKGRLKHPHFEQVRSLMGTMIASGRASDLDTAYDMACRADPDVNAKIASAQRAAEEREQQRQRRAKAEAASKAGKSISGSPGQRAMPEASDDIREDMRRQLIEKGVEVKPFY